MKKILFLRSVVWAVAILVFCAIPGDNLPKTKLIMIPHIDKIAHFGMFFVMGIFLYALLKAQGRLRSAYVFFVSILLVAMYGGIIEYLQQYYFSNRSGDYWDFASDVFGGGLGLAMYPWLKKQKDLLLNSKPFQRISFKKKAL